VVARAFAIVGIAVVGAAVASGNERPHPTLVDPATTRCTVCHTTVATTHVDEATRGRPCLDCHAFNETHDGTSLTAQAAGANVVRSVAPEPAPDRAQTSTPPDNTAVAAGAVGGAPSEAPAEAPPMAGSPTAGSPTSAATAPIAAGPASDRTQQLYVDGLQAFNRGRFDEAFDTWRVMLVGNPDAWVLQVEIDSLITSAQSTLARYGDHGPYVVPKGDLHYVLSGVFASENAAGAALRDLPQPLRSGGAFPIRAREILAGR